MLRSLPLCDLRVRDLRSAPRERSIPSL